LCDIEKINLVNGEEDQDPQRGYRAKKEKKDVRWGEGPNLWTFRD